MLASLFAKSRSRRRVRDLVRALHEGVKGETPTPEEIQRWIRAVEGGKTHAEIAAAIVASLRVAAPAPEAADSTFNPYGVKIFVPPGHFYSPIAEPKEAAEGVKRADRYRSSPTLPAMNIDRAALVATWREFLPMFEMMRFPDKPSGGFRYGFDNDFYAWGDGAVYSAMVRKFRPAQVIEIGCGWSSACLVDTLERTPGLTCNVTFIEPDPYVLRDRLGDSLSKFRLIDKRVQDVDPETFAALSENDVLFIDSTHVLRPGSDVCYELFEILPRLNSGVIVHIHDIQWPFEYKTNWILEDNRSWNEIYAYHAFLMYNSDWEILMYSNYLRALEPDLWPEYLKLPGAGLWLRKK